MCLSQARRSASSLGYATRTSSSGYTPSRTTQGSRGYCFPRRQSAAELRHEPIVLIGDDSDPSNRKHILVVDDDKVTLRLLKTAQEEKFYNVTALANGKVAEKYLQTKTVVLILLDYQMPIESGAEVLKNIPVIFLTGVSDSDRVQEVISMKPQGYLLKPVNMERLFVMIRNLI
ncbi:MAG: response regulator [Ruminococcaceae bacterium]|nr:response regulator [Oscillospiraceae bacterium]